MRKISKNEANKLRKMGFGNVIFSTHTKHKTYFLEERCKAEIELEKIRRNYTSFC